MALDVSTPVAPVRQASAPAPVDPAPVAPAPFAHLPALDGLRGVAVALVVAYHLFPDVVPGGFLGVDVFFVLSGFLITSLLVREHESTGGVALGRFYVRRLRRLTPALVLVIAALSVYAVVAAGPGELDRLRAHGIASLGWFANWRFILDGTTYADVVAGASPLRHMWSLAIEEQFYLVFPFSVLGIAAVVGRSRLRTTLLWTAALGALASAVWMAVVSGSSTGIERAYFGTDTRAHGLLVGVALGAALAGVPPTADRLGRGGGRWLARLAPVAAAAVVVVVFTTSQSDGWLYRGGFLAVAIGVAAVIGVCGSEGAVARGLRWRPLVLLGVISYGVYLWHWPVIVLVDTERTGLAGLPLAMVQLALTLVVSVASYVLVERPIRNGALGRHLGRWAILTAPVGFAAAALVLVLATIGPPAPEVVARAARSSGTVPPAVADDPVRAVLTGDSVAFTLAGGWLGSDASAIPPWDPAASPFDPAVVHLHSVARPQCSFLAGSVLSPTGMGRQPLESSTACAGWQDELAAALAAHEAEVLVVVPAAESADRLVDGNVVTLGSAEWQRLLNDYLDTLDALAADTGTHLAIVVPPPRTGRFFVDPTDDGIARELLLGDALRSWAAAHPAHAVVEFGEALCPAGNCGAPPEGFDPAWRYDGLHVTPEGARWFADWIAPQLVTLARP